MHRKRPGPRVGVCYAVRRSLSHIATMTIPDAALPALDGAALSALWGLPFAGLLLSIALLPIVARGFWHRHYGKITLAWGLAFLLPYTLRFGATEAVHGVAHAILLEYLPFLIVLFALYTIAGGIGVRTALAPTPGRNTMLLAFGTALASVMGTTGA